MDALGEGVVVQATPRLALAPPDGGHDVAAAAVGDASDSSSSTASASSVDAGAKGPLPSYTRAEVSQHNSAGDCWFILEDKVINHNKG